MLTVGLTGNVAAGKSTVAEWLRAWGATVIDADVLVRELQQPGSPVLDAIVAVFGPEVLLEDGHLDRARLRHQVMADPEARAQLNAIVHPAVEERRRAQVAEARARGDAVVVCDIPLLFETGQAEAFDVVVLVDAAPDRRRTRLIRDRGLSAAEAEALLAAQWPAERKRPLSDHVIDNDATLEALEEATRAVWHDLQQRARTERHGA